MKKYTYLLINVAIFFCISQTFLFGQLNKKDNHRTTDQEYFKRLDRIPNYTSLNRSHVNFYPNSIGDFWEYIETDTTTLLGQLYTDLKFSISREVLNDTLLSNGISYKKIRWMNEANSVSYPPVYNFQRVDTSGNVYIFYDNSDHLLYDFTKQIGETYSSHLINHYWQITDRYTVVGFGDTLLAIDFALYEQGAVLRETYSVIEKFGICYYKTNWDYPSLPGGNFWGAVIDGQEFGTLIVKKQTVDWSEFYPLHLGDYWVYEGNSGPIPTLNTVRVIGDTLMPDGIIYASLSLIDYIFNDTGYSYIRLDSIGNVFFWDIVQNKSVRILSFNEAVGDTMVLQNANDLLIRLEDKYMTDNLYLEFLLYPSLIYHLDIYALGLGLIASTIELNNSTLVGAIIDGVVWGDTTITEINEIQINSEPNFILYQNYPNPFNPTTTISWNSPEEGFVGLMVFDILGREVALLVNEHREAGVHSTEFNATELSSGVYIYRIHIGEYIQSRCFILQK